MAYPVQAERENRGILRGWKNRGQNKGRGWIQQISFKDSPPGCTDGRWNIRRLSGPNLYASPVFLVTSWHCPALALVEAVQCYQNERQQEIPVDDGPGVAGREVVVFQHVDDMCDPRTPHEGGLG
jgi:hypothetical protein